MPAAPDTAPKVQPRAWVSDDLCSATVRYVRLDAIETRNPIVTDEGTDAYHTPPGPVPARLLALLEDIENDPKLTGVDYHIGDRTFGLAMDVLTRYIESCGDPLTDEKKRSDAVLGGLSLACKFNEVCTLEPLLPWALRNLVAYSKTSTVEAIKAMELEILREINWGLWELLPPDEARGHSEEGQGLRGPWGLGGQMPYSSQRRSRAARDDEHNAERDLAGEAETKRRKAL